MSICGKCGKKLTLFNKATDEICNSCVSGQPVTPELKEGFVDEVEAILLTTETAPTLNITKRIGIVTAECAFGMNVFKDMFAGLRDVVGGRSKAVQKTLRDTRQVALYELKKEAHELGANAVVGVDLDYVELSGVGNMILLVASGTAVVVSGE